MKALFPGVLLPDGKILRNVDAFDAVQGHHVKVPDRFIVLRRVAGGHDQPALGETLVAEGLALEELEHHGGQGLGDAVDLIEKQDTLPQARFFHKVIDACQNLAHGILCDGEFRAAVIALFDKGQANGALAGVVGDGVGHKAHAGLRGDLLHDLGFADARRAHEQHGALAEGGDEVIAQLIPLQVRPEGILNLLFCLFDVHSVVSFGKRAGEDTGPYRVIS